MGERIRRIGRIDTDFALSHLFEIREKSKKKSVSIRPIRPIRSPIVSQRSKIYSKTILRVTLGNASFSKRT
jgi:hypothetical protein